MIPHFLTTLRKLIGHPSIFYFNFDGFDMAHGVRWFYDHTMIHSLQLFGRLRFFNHVFRIMHSMLGHDYLWEFQNSTFQMRESKSEMIPNQNGNDSHALKFGYL